MPVRRSGQGAQWQEQWHGHTCAVYLNAEEIADIVLRSLPDTLKEAKVRPAVVRVVAASAQDTNRTRVCQPWRGLRSARTSSGPIQLKADDLGHTLEG